MTFVDCYVSIRSRHSRPGESARTTARAVKVLVSIRSRHRAGRNRYRHPQRGNQPVSIRSRHRGREKDGCPSSVRAIGVSIRSRHRAGRKRRVADAQAEQLKFQSAPGNGPGEEVDATAWRREEQFQSAPGNGPGGSRPREAAPPAVDCFNPLPASGREEASRCGQMSSRMRRVSIRSRHRAGRKPAGRSRSHPL